MIKQSEDIQKCRFPAAGRAHNGNKFTIHYLNIYFVQRRGLHFICAENLYEIYGLDHIV